MSCVKAVPKEFKWIECECGVRGKNFSIRYIHKQDPVQDDPKKSKKTTYFIDSSSHGEQAQVGNLGIRDF